MKKLKPPIKTQGGKHSLSGFILESFPEGYEKLVYCEPFCAGASIFLNKDRSSEEILSDIDKGIICILKGLRDEPKEFIARIKRINYTERTFKMALNKSEIGFEDYLDQAVNEYILRRMSRGGLKKHFAQIDKENESNNWQSILQELTPISERLQNTTIVCESFANIMKVWDEENTLFYLDPPYLQSNRNESLKELSENEMSVEDHMHLLHLAKNARGKIIISGYSSPLYNRTLKNWKCRKKNVVGQSKIKDRRIECIWYNY